MSSIFSTVINFGMLCLLCQLHRMNIQFCLEAESQETGISGLKPTEPKTDMVMSQFSVSKI